MTEAMQAADPPQTNGIDSMDEDERAKNRPADIDADVKEMERRKRVEHIMNSKMFREELERIIETQMSEGTGTNSLMQQISDMMGVNKQGGNFYKNSSCVLPINDIRGIEAMGYGKGEKILRCKLAAVYRLIDLCGWNQGTANLVTARLNQDEEHFLVNPYGMLYHEITASSLIKVDMQANIVEQGTTNFSVNISAFSLHGAIHAARPDIKCIIQLHTPSVVAISATKAGILPISQESVVIGEVSTHPFLGGLIDPEEKDKLARNLGPNNKVLLLTNQGVLCCGETIEEAFFNARNTVLACEAQLKLLPMGLDNIILLNEESRKKIYESAHKAPESTPRPDKPTILEGKVERKWRVGGVEFEGLMRMLDNVGFRTGYIYRHPLVKGDVPRPKNDVEVPPAVSSLGYLLEEEELYKKGLWRHLGEGKKGQFRSRWLNSPNVYQRVEFLETGTQDPKKITKWVADGSPTHSSTPVKIDNALQFVPKNTNPKEFKLKQQQIKDYRRADKISAGPQSYILDTLSWEEAKKMQDASLNQTGDQVVLMGAASKGIIQRGHQHNAMVYKSPYAKNPFDCVTDEELDEYKKNVEKKVKGDYDTDYSESELSSAAINKRIDGLHLRSPTSETEEESRDEPQVLRIETKQAPRPSQPEVVLSDGYQVQDNFKNLNDYRTNSHFGLPKGSYLIPNPQHFHIVQKKEICKLEKPLLKLLTPYNISSDYLFNHNRNKRKSNPIVTVNIDDTNSVSLHIPMETLKGFILPFANALNIPSLPKLNAKACQTIYMNNFQYETPDLSKLDKDYTPLLINPISNTECYKITDETTSFEAQILKIMKENILDLSFNNEIKNFDENDEIESNEGLVDSTLFVEEHFADFDSSKINEIEKEMKYDDNCSNEINRKDLLHLYESCDDKACLENLMNETLQKIEDQINANEVHERMMEIEEDIEPQIEDEKMNPDEINENVTFVVEEDPNLTFNIEDVDEGIEDPEMKRKKLTPVKIKCLDSKIQNISKKIYEYLERQCFEIRELVLFPEILHDRNLNKLLANLKNTYDELYPDKLTNDEKTELRIKISANIMSTLEHDSNINQDSSNESSFLNIISDKIFTISEFVSDILDNFFNIISESEFVVVKEDSNGENFLEFTKPFRDSNGNLLHSTPDSPQSPEENIIEPSSVTSFKKNKSKNSETFWITCNSNLQKQDSTPSYGKQRLFNIDDIPLRPPDDFLLQSSSSNKSLRSIPEEPRCNLFGSSYKDENDTINLDTESYKTAEFDYLGGGDGSYVSFNGDEDSEAVLINEVKFSRSKTVQSNPFIKSDSVDIFRNSTNNENNDEGDWMGYEMAKF